MTRKNNKKFLKAFQTRKAFSHKLSDVLVRESVVGDPLGAVCLRKVVRESLPEEVSKASFTHFVSSTLAGLYFSGHIDFTSVGHAWHVNCAKNTKRIRYFCAKIAETQRTILGSKLLSTNWKSKPSVWDRAKKKPAGVSPGGKGLTTHYPAVVRPGKGSDDKKK
jgi:hypothetical protein